MSGIEAAKKLYNTCRDMDIEETMELVLNAETEEEGEGESALARHESNGCLISGFPAPKL